MKTSLIGLLLVSMQLIATGQQTGTTTVTIDTELGTILVELYPEKAPITVANFLNYIEKGYYRNSEFYRTVTNDNQPDDNVKIEVIQGGIWNTRERPDIPAISHETTEMTGIKHLDGTISMARYTPGTATSEFFICVNAQPYLDYGGDRNPDNQGFAAFGRVIKGMDTVRKIHQSNCTEQTLSPTIMINNIIINR